MQPAYPLRSVANALDLLQMFRTWDTVRVTDAAAHLGVARSTAHRLLAMLESAGFATQDPRTRTYASGPVLVALGLEAVRNLDVRQRAKPHMSALSHEVDETVNLMGLEGPNVRFVECVESSRSLRVAARTGLLRPAHTNSVGKVLLAAMPPDELAQLYPDEVIEPLTPRTLDSRTRLVDELHQVRLQGFGTNFGESDPDLAAVGVIIPSTSGTPRWGLGVSAPRTRIADDETVRRIAEAAKRAAHATWADEAGGSGPAGPRASS
ncbi:IclR family transcriptional regulator [Egibacter rhizosphaerae]|nr:IclR family transcriptional regulator [Egibacter rhizosphaerae]